MLIAPHGINPLYRVLPTVELCRVAPRLGADTSFAEAVFRPGEEDSTVVNAVVFDFVSGESRRVGETLAPVESGDRERERV